MAPSPQAAFTAAWWCSSQITRSQHYTPFENRLEDLKLPTKWHVNTIVLYVDVGTCNSRHMPICHKVKFFGHCLTISVRGAMIITRSISSASKSLAAITEAHMVLPAPGCIDYKMLIDFYFGEPIRHFLVASYCQFLNSIFGMFRTLS